MNETFWNECMIEAMRRGKPPPVFKTRNKTDLAMWFLCFAMACRATLKPLGKT